MKITSKVSVDRVIEHLEVGMIRRIRNKENWEAVALITDIFMFFCLRSVSSLTIT